MRPACFRIAVIAAVFMVMAGAYSPAESRAMPSGELDLRYSNPRIDFPVLKNPYAAALYSFSTTSIPVMFGFMFEHHLPRTVFILSGLYLGPTVGLVYGSSPNRAWWGVGIRTIALLPIGISYYYGWSGEVGISYRGDHFRGGGQNVFYTGVLVMLGSALYDIFISSPLAVNEHNRRLQFLASPWVNETGAGMAVTLSF